MFPVDATESADSDNDGIGDNSDPYNNDPDGDGLRNVEDDDDDGDGVNDINDAFRWMPQSRLIRTLMG